MIAGIRSLHIEWHNASTSCSPADAQRAVFLAVECEIAKLGKHYSDAGLHHWARWVRDLPSVHDEPSAHAVLHALTRLGDEANVVRIGCMRILDGEAFAPGCGLDTEHEPLEDARVIERLSRGVA